jgi:hypothetical protein
VFRRAHTKRRITRRSLRELARMYFASENSLEFVLEALLFAIMIAISLWPIIAADRALTEFLRAAPG